MKPTLKLLLATALATPLLGAQAASFTVSGLQFSVYADADYPFCCGVVKDQAFVTNFNNDETARAMAEFNLSGLPYRGEPVYLAFDYITSASYGGFGFYGPVSLVAYLGDNFAARPDFSAASIGNVGSFMPATTAPQTHLVYDVTNLYQYATRAGFPSLGIRLSGGSVPGFNSVQYASFDHFTLSTVPPVPEPSTMALSALSLAGLVAWRGRARRPAR